MKVSLTLKIERTPQPEPIYVELATEDIKRMGFQPNPIDEEDE